MNSSGKPWTKLLRRLKTSGTSSVRAVIDSSCGRLVSGWLDLIASDRWTSVGCAEQVLALIGTEGAFTILYGCKNCWLMSKDHFMCFFKRKREIARSLKARPRCCCAYCAASMKLALSLSSCNMVTKTRRAWSIRLGIHRRETRSR